MRAMTHFLTLVAVVLIYIGSLFAFLMLADAQDLRDYDLRSIRIGADGAATPTVEVFVTSWCPYCKSLEAFLQARNIPYVRYDIEADSQGESIYRRLGGGGIPIVRIGSVVMRGFDPDSILRTLAGARRGAEPSSF